MITREEILAHVKQTYHVTADYPWSTSPTHAVLRHEANKKWFALIMEVPKCKLGLDGDALVDIIDLKCNPLLIGALRAEPGVFPAYHMNKEHWITIRLDSPFLRDTLYQLIDESYHLTM
jgi:predicted DNA-binding protein (MmcQ/YjbR family)